jgi:hypothetical protein
MERTATLPFYFNRGKDAMTAVTVTTTRETVHGLLRLEGSRLTIQWRLATKTERVGWDVRTDHEVEPVKEIVVPVGRMAGGTVRRGWWAWPPGLHLVLRAVDLTALEGLAGEDGLNLDHPSEVVLRLRRSDRLAAEEFCAELALAIAEGQIAAHEESPPLHPGLRLSRSRPPSEGPGDR